MYKLIDGIFEWFPDINVKRLFPAGERVEHKDIDRNGIVAKRSDISDYPDVFYGTWEVPVIWDGAIDTEWVSCRDLIRLT